MPSLQQLRYLVALADKRSFSRAAEVTHVTQPTLSMQIRDLEKRLDAQLVERNRSGVVLTPVGAEISRRARAILSEVEDIRALARAGVGKLTGTLRVGGINTVGGYLMYLLAPELRDAYPGLRLYVRDEPPDILLDRLIEGRHDIVICPLPILREDVVTVPIFRELLQVVLPDDHRLAARAEVERTDLAGETVLTMERGHRLYGQIAQLCAEVGANLTEDYEGTSLDTLRQMVAMRMGIALMPALYVRSEVRRERVVVSRPLAGAAPFRDVSFVWRRNSPRADDFHDLCSTVRQVLRRKAPEVKLIEGRSG